MQIIFHLQKTSLGGRSLLTAYQCSDSRIIIRNIVTRILITYFSPHLGITHTLAQWRESSDPEINPYVMYPN